MVTSPSSTPAEPDSALTYRGVNLEEHRSRQWSYAGVKLERVQASATRPRDWLVPAQATD